jgi:D-alanyl-lipoteichoic acid acyltransferase DltB (MBOAT superfamily)
LLFHTLEFAILVALVWPTYLLLRRLRAQNILLLVASYVFYGWWEWRYIPLLLFSTAVDYIIGRALDGEERPARRRQLLLASCVANLGLLGFFKYWGWFASTSNGIASWLGIDATLPELHLLLPVGISFYTFQSMAYTIDVYRRHFPAWKSFVEFAAYISYFPQLVAGPIERPDNLLRAMGSPRTVTLDGVEEGIFLFAKGWLLKALADVLAGVADPIFAAPADQDPWALLCGVYAFTFQVYGDFFGYSQMARGIARLFGFRLMENFRAPFFAPSLRLLWNRWHISLTGWLRDYLFISLGGLRGGTARAARNLFLTLLLAGLWHGAAGHFVVWGGLLGAAIALQYVLLDQSAPGRRQLLRRRPLFRSAWATAGTLVSFHIFALSCVFFRAQPTESGSAWQAAIDYYAGLASLPAAVWHPPPLAMWVIAIPVASDLLQLRYGTSYWSQGWPWPVRGIVLGLMLTGAVIFASPEPRAFIYFQF